MPVWREIFLTRTRDEWLEAFAGPTPASARVNDFAEATDDPQLRHREMVVEAEHPTEGTVRQVAPPFKLREHPAAIGGPPPRLGEGTRDFLGEAGYAPAEIESLLDDGVVAGG